MTDEFQTVHYKTGYRHQLEKEYEQWVAKDGIFPVNGPGGNKFVWLTIDGRLIIREGYAWDGASGPAVNTKSFVRPSLPHDALYQLRRLGVIDDAGKAAADKLLGRMLRHDSLIIANRYQYLPARWALKAIAYTRPVWVEAAVSWFGTAYMHANKDAVLTAP